MKIKLNQDHSIRGVVEKSGAVVDISEGVAQDLIDRGIADKTSKASKTAKTGKKAGK